MGQHRLRFKNETGQAQQRLRLAFATTRSVIKAVRVADSSEQLLPTLAYIPGRMVLYLEFTSAIPDQQFIWVLIDFADGEPPRVIEERNWGHPAVQLYPSSAWVDVAALNFKNLVAEWDFFSVTQAWDRFLADEPDADRRRYKAFFHALDLATNPMLKFARAILGAQEQQNALVLADAMQTVNEHLSIRLQSIAAQHWTQLKELPIEAEPLTATAVSKLMLPAYDTFFRENGVLDQRHIARAFCRFADGELRMGDTFDSNPWNCEPDSAQLFHFASHALWSVRAGVDAADWARIFPCCAAAQEFYLEAYRPGGNPPYLLRRYAPWNYRPAGHRENNVTEDHQDEQDAVHRLKNSVIDAVLAKYEAMSLDELSQQLDVNLVTMLAGSRTVGKHLLPPSSPLAELS